jgi:hypothetical protein
MYIINVITDDESKIGLYEIYFLNVRRFASRDKISHYFDRFICQRLYYDAEIA